MEVPAEDRDISVVIQAVNEVQAALEDTRFATLSELHNNVSRIIQPYVSYGGGFERLRVQLCKDSATQDLRKDLDIMKEICDNTLKLFERCENDLIYNILPFIHSSSKILVHGSGNLLAAAIARSIQHHEGVQFYICEGLPRRDGCPSGSGAELLRKASETAESQHFKEKLGQSCTIIPDSGVGAVLGVVDFVVMGAYCVTEHGGLVHSTGSFQIATLATSRNVPCYVMCETFKFSQVFPLSTEDLKQPKINQNVDVVSVSSIVPLVEFVPPSLVTLIFSEEGIMPPSAVAGEIFRMYTAQKF